jgi:hypothetical protein
MPVEPLVHSLKSSSISVASASMHSSKETASRLKAIRDIYLLAFQGSGVANCLSISTDSSISTHAKCHERKWRHLQVCKVVAAILSHRRNNLGARLPDRQAQKDALPGCSCATYNAYVLWLTAKQRCQGQVWLLQQCHILWPAGFPCYDKRLQQSRDLEHQTELARESPQDLTTDRYRDLN